MASSDATVSISIGGKGEGMTQHKWRDTVHDPLPYDSIHFMLFGRVPTSKAAYERTKIGGPPPHNVRVEQWSCWYVYEGPGPLQILMARAKVLRAEGIDTRILRCHVLKEELENGD